MSRVHSFPPLADAQARLLILGSMPGRASLQANQYYAHPRNAFWPIMGSLIGFAADDPYQRRCDALLAAGVALWDVMASCRRQGCAAPPNPRGRRRPLTVPLPSLPIATILTA